MSGYHGDTQPPKSTGSTLATDVHPCHKPISVIMPLIRTWSNPGDIVLDPFHGSGGVLSAVMRAGEGRRYKGIERLPKWHAYVRNLLLWSVRK